jgi:hypothetical protein
MDGRAEAAMDGFTAFPGSRFLSEPQQLQRCDWW